LISTENTWNQQPILIIMDFLKLLLSIEGDGLLTERLQEVLLNPNHGFAAVIISEK